MVSFAQMWRIVENEKAKFSPLMHSGEDDRQLSTVRTGQQLHNEKQIPFWDEFMSLCSDTEGLSQLLGVSKEMVSTWPARIREAIDKLEKRKRMNPTEKEDTKVMPTGDNGAFTTNSDPINIGDAQ